MENNDHAAEKLWNVVRKIVLFVDGMNSSELIECFGTCRIAEIMEKPYQEVLTEYDKWNDTKEKTFRIGDEVIIEGMSTNGIIITTMNDEYVVLVNDSGVRSIIRKGYGLKKTGRHFEVLDDIIDALVDYIN